MSDYSWGEKIAMLRQVTVECRSVKEVAGDHQLKPCVLSQLLCRAKKDKNYMPMMLEKQEEHVHHRKLVIEAVISLCADDDQIASVRQVRDHIQKEHEVVLSESLIASVLKEDLRMRYSRIREQALHVNSPLNVHKRQGWAQTFLRHDIQNKVILNVDESWLDKTDYRRRSWSAVGQKNAQSKKQLTPRISLTVALDTLGNVYYSLSQSNNNS
jgi:hypothetical protein